MTKEKKKVSKKKSKKKADGLRLDFTGTMVVVFETTEWGPIEFRVADDRELVLDILARVIRDRNPFDVSWQTKLEEGVLQGMIAEANAL